MTDSDTERRDDIAESRQQTNRIHYKTADQLYTIRKIMDNINTQKFGQFEEQWLLVCDYWT